MSCIELLTNDAFYAGRRQFSLSRIAELKAEAKRSAILSDRKLSLFVAGSLGRLEMGEKSDIDFFPITLHKKYGESYLKTCQVVSELATLNEKFEGPTFSNDGRFLRLYRLSELIDRTGYEDDDSGNHFTTRMLLLLEGRALLNESGVNRVRKDVAKHYFRDSRGKSSFRPLFLINDMLRYWRTLCLNYEIVRNEARPWRKKNINLKFSRMVTVFGSVMAILTEPVDNAEKLISLCNSTPMERLAASIDRIGDQGLLSEFPQVLGLYRQFLEWKEEEDIEQRLDGLRDEISESAAEFADFIYRGLFSNKVPKELQRYLVI